MNQLLIASTPTPPALFLRFDLSPAKEVMVEGAKHAACTLIVLSDLRKKKGAEVSVNVRTSEAREEEIGKFICISHPLITKKPRRRLVPATDEQLVQQLLLKVQEVVPSTQMKWNDKDICWYIVVPKI